MQFGILDSHMQTCEQHLDATGMRNTEVEFYLVQFLLIRICAEWETRIKALVHLRCSRSDDDHIRNFVQRGAKETCKYFNISEIKGRILAPFGDDYKQAFHDLMEADMGLPPKLTPVSAWNTIYSNRQGVAHGTGQQMSFNDLKDSYQASLPVLDAIVAALELTPDEIKDLT